MEVLELMKAGRPVAEVTLGPRPIEVGSASGCDLVVCDPALAPRALLVQADGGTVWVAPLGPAGAVGARVVLAPGVPRRLGRHHVITRRRKPAQPGPSPAERTEPLGGPGAVGASLRLRVGRGGEARGVRLARGPVGVGTGAHNRVVLSDRAVSAEHCRFEPTEGGVLVRDLGSRNGTWVRGLRVDKVLVGAGEVVRVGRTDLHVVDEGASPEDAAGALVAVSPAMRAVLAQIDRVAPLPWPVLVHGESGVGKEMVASALHRASGRSDGPLVAVNAGSLPPQLVETELFGHERGAFTGAGGLHRGVFEQAHGGTLFLDEIGELPLELQARLLRVLETWEVRRVGAEASIPVDVRLVAATHRDLRAMVGAGRFREDLYYRIRRLVVRVPPLRRRPEDVRALARHFLRKMEPHVGRRWLSDEAESRLLAHRWPGNARELRNVLELAVVGCPEATLAGHDVAAALAEVAGPGVESGPVEGLREVVERYGGNVTAAARALGVPRSTLRDRLERAHAGEGETSLSR